MHCFLQNSLLNAGVGIYTDYFIDDDGRIHVNFLTTSSNELCSVFLYTCEGDVLENYTIPSSCSSTVTSSLSGYDKNAFYFLEVACGPQNTTDAQVILVDPAYNNGMLNVL